MIKRKLNIPELILCWKYLSIHYLSNYFEFSFVLSGYEICNILHNEDTIKEIVKNFTIVIIMEG